MLNNTITTGPVDLSTNGGSATDTRTLTRYEEAPNKTIYVDMATHTPYMRDAVQFSRSFPTRVGTFKGVSKSTVKSTVDLEVAGTDGNYVKAPLIIEVNFSIPVGAGAYQIDRARRHMANLLSDNSLLDMINIQQQI